MPKEDYLLKYLEKLSRVIAAMLGFREKGLPQNSIRLADEAYKELLGVNIEELTIMQIGSFDDLIKKNRYNASYLELIAQLAHQTALAYKLDGNEAIAINYFTKALHLYYMLNEKDKTFSLEREMIIENLKKALTI